MVRRDTAGPAPAYYAAEGAQGGGLSPRGDCSPGEELVLCRVSKHGMISPGSLSCPIHHPPPSPEGHLVLYGHQGAG